MTMQVAMWAHTTCVWWASDGASMLGPAPRSNPKLPRSQRGSWPHDPGRLFCQLLHQFHVGCVCYGPRAVEIWAAVWSLHQMIWIKIISWSDTKFIFCRLVSLSALKTQLSGSPCSDSAKNQCSVQCTRFLLCIFQAIASSVCTSQWVTWLFAVFQSLFLIARHVSASSQSGKCCLFVCFHLQLTHVPDVDFFKYNRSHTQSPWTAVSELHAFQSASGAKHR